MTSPTTPIHRAAAQIKVFCDKGAERKIRDEERKSLKKKQKNTTFVVHPNDIKGMISTGRKFDIVYFRTLEDTSTTPIYFTPDSSNSIADPMVRDPKLVELWLKSDFFRHFSNHDKGQVKYLSKMNPRELIFMINKEITKAWKMIEIFDFKNSKPKI